MLKGPDKLDFAMAFVPHYALGFGVSRIMIKGTTLLLITNDHLDKHFAQNALIIVDKSFRKVQFIIIEKDSKYRLSTFCFTIWRGT